MIWRGGCQCGSVRYELAVDPIVVYTCHCSECQWQSSSAFGISAWIAPADFSLVSGKLHRWSTVADSGRTKTCTFCGLCGSRIHHSAPGNDNVYSIKGGSLDGRVLLRPCAHIWVRSAQFWIRPMLGGLPCYDTQPDDFGELIQRYRKDSAGRPGSGVQ